LIVDRMSRPWTVISAPRKPPNASASASKLYAYMSSMGF
jgi:hypothetical protein